MADEAQNYDVFYTTDGHGTADPTVNEDVQVLGTDKVTGSAATPNAGYKFEGWYKVGAEEPFSTEAALSAVDAAANLNRNAETGLFEDTTYTAKFQADFSEFEIGIQAADQSWTYDGSTRYLDITGVYPGDSVKFEFLNEDGSVIEDKTIDASVDADGAIVNAPSFKNVADTSTVQVTVSRGGQSASGTASMTISTASLYVATPDATKTYNGTPLTAEGTISGFVKVGDTVETATFRTTGLVANVEDANNGVTGNNTYQIIWDGTALKSNYTVYEDLGTLTLTSQSITPGEDPEPDPSYFDIRVDDPTSSVYNGTANMWNPVVTDPANSADQQDEILAKDVDYTVTYLRGENETTDFVNAGTITVVIAGIGNYKGEVIKHYTISPAAALITVDDSSKIYGANDPAFTGAVTLTDGSPLYINALTGVVDIIGDVTYSRTNSDEDADTYPGVLTATVANANGNYTYTVEPGDFTISRAGDNNVTIETAVEDRSKTYDGQPITIDATATESGSTLWYSTDGENWTETKPSLTNVGSLTIYVKATNPNYEDSPLVSATVQVTPATLTVTTDSLGKVFDGTALTAGGKVTGFVNNEAATFAVTGSQTEVGSSVNDYSLVFDQTAQQSNYTVAESLGILTVWPQSIDPTDPGENPDPDDPDAPDPTDPDPGYDPDDPDPEDPDQPFYTGIKVQGPDPQMYDAADQTPGVVVTDKNGKVLEEGTDYRITGYDNNYNVTTEDSLAIIHVEGIGNYRGNVDVEFEITPAPLTVTTPSAGKVYDGSALTAGPADVEGLQGSDATAVAITANGTQTDVGNSVNGVSYDWGQVLASNYSITEDLGTLTVWPQSIDPTDPGENPDPDDPDPVTPVTPLPTPDPTPVPTPTPGDPGATETTTTPATEEATETIDDEATPLTAPEPIDDDGTPLASGAHRDCWVHWLMLLGILVTVVYYGGVGVRRVRFSSSLQSFEDDILGNDETNR